MPPTPLGDTGLAEPRLLTASPATVVNASVYDLLWEGLPDADGAEDWVAEHDSVERWLRRQDDVRALVVDPGLARSGVGRPDQA